MVNTYTDFCYPEEGMTCSPVSVVVTATHLNTTASDEVSSTFLSKQKQIITLIDDIEGYTPQ